MRIASLVPSATEMLFALGLGDSVVAVTHECDYPAPARDLPQLTRTVIPPGLDAAEIDAEVKRVTAAGRALYELDEERLREVAPDLVVTQAVCEVCAVSYEDVVAIAGRLPARPPVLSLDPSTLEDVLDDVIRLAGACAASEAGHELRAELEGRLATVRAAVDGLPRRRVVCLEWLDPPYTGGHWVPQMVAAAGGEDVAGKPGEKSAQTTWSALRRASPDLAVVMPCGLYVDEASQEAIHHRSELEALGAEVRAVDAASSFSRPGPRLVDGVELLAHLFHPAAADRPATVGFAALGAG
jgi:iron complex transport system substrate-binding protein